MISTFIAQAQNIFGEIKTPAPIAAFGGGAQGGGLIIFISNMIKVVTIFAGLFGLFNVISAGYTLLSSSGNPKATEEATQKMVYSLIGLIIIVGSFTIIALVGLILFGDAGYFLNPKLPSVQ